MVERKGLTEKHGVIFVIYDGQKIQLEKRVNKNDKYYGYITIPGGMVEQGEAPQNALVREIREEYGATFVNAKELGGVESIEGDGQPNFRHVFLVDGWSGRLSNPEHENIHIKATIEQARKICKHPVTQRALDLVEAELFRQNS